MIIKSTYFNFDIVGGVLTVKQNLTSNFVTRVFLLQNKTTEDMDRRIEEEGGGGDWVASQPP